LIRAVLFDLDGTLIDSRADLTDAVNAALDSIGRERQPMDKVVRHVGNGMHALLSAVLGPTPDEVLESAIVSFRTFYAAHCLDHTALYSGVADTLKALSKKAPLAVVTNKPGDFSEKILGGLGVLKMFGAVVGGDALPEKKPHPAPLLKAAQMLGVAPAEALMVGDGPQDISAAAAAGMKACVARYGFGFHGRGTGKADHAIDRFGQLKEIVK
jgi:phosphoglycolate phosphatase